MTTNINLLSSSVLLASRHLRAIAQPMNAKAPVTFMRSIEINASPEKVWDVLTGINEWSNWQTDIKKAFIKGSLTIGATFDWVSGGAKIHSTIHTVQPFEAIGWTGKGIGIFAIHNWMMQERDGVVTVHVHESMEGFLPNILKGYLNKSLERSVGRWMEFLKEECEKK